MGVGGGVWEVGVVLAPVDVPYRTNTLRVHHLSIHHHPPTTDHTTTHTVLHTQYTPVIHNWPCCTTLSSFISLSPSLSLLENKLSIVLNTYTVRHCLQRSSDTGQVEFHQHMKQ